MKSILELMFFGKKFKSDTIRFTERGKENLRRREEMGEKFSKNLSAEQKARFTEYTEEIIDIFADEEMLQYIEGVKIGILIVLEAAETLVDK